MSRRTVGAVTVLKVVLTCLLVLPGQALGETLDWQIHKKASIRIMAPKNPNGLRIESLVPEFEKLTGIKAQ